MSDPADIWEAINRRDISALMSLLNPPHPQQLPVSRSAGQEGCLAALGTGEGSRLLEDDQ